MSSYRHIFLLCCLGCVYICSVYWGPVYSHTCESMLESVDENGGVTWLERWASYFKCRFRLLSSPGPVPSAEWWWLASRYPSQEHFNFEQCWEARAFYFLHGKRGRIKKPEKLHCLILQTETAVFNTSESSVSREYFAFEWMQLTQCMRVVPLRGAGRRQSVTCRCF